MDDDYKILCERFINNADIELLNIYYVAYMQLGLNATYSFFPKIFGKHFEENFQNTTDVDSRVMLVNWLEVPENYKQIEVALMVEKL